MRPLFVTTLFALALLGGLSTAPASPLQRASAPPARDHLSLGIGIGLSDNCYLIDRDEAGLSLRGGHDLVRECD